MLSPYITQALAEAKVAEMRIAARSRNGVVRRRPAKSRDRIRAWWDAQVHPGRRSAATRPAMPIGEVATCSR